MKIVLARRFIQAAIAGLALMSCFAAGASAPQASDDELVRKTVEIYLHGLKFNDVANFEKVFDPGAKLMFVNRDGGLGELTQQQWYAGFKSVAGKEEDGELDIVSIEVTGTAASVKVRETYPKSIYTDYLSLLRIRGEWKIVNKIYTSERR